MTPSWGGERGDRRRKKCRIDFTKLHVSLLSSNAFCVVWQPHFDTLYVYLGAFVIARVSLLIDLNFVRVVAQLFDLTSSSFLYLAAVLVFFCVAFHLCSAEWFVQFLLLPPLLLRLPLLIFKHTPTPTQRLALFVTSACTIGGVETAVYYHGQL